MAWDKKDFDVLCIVLKKLNKKSDYLWRNGLTINGTELSDNLIRTYSSLIDEKRPLSLGELEKIIDEAQDLQLSWDKTYFYFPPLNDPEFVTTFKFECNFTSPNPSIKFRIEMHRYKDEGKTKLFGFGFRFETGSPETGHDFLHMQISTRPSPSKKLFSGCSGFIPTSIPCIPAIAKCPVSLLFFILICFYGKRMYNKIFPPEMMDFVKSRLEPLTMFL